MPLAKLISTIAAASWSRLRYAAGSNTAICGTGSPLGSSPVTATPSARRSKTATAPMPAITATNAPGTAGATRPRIRSPATRPRPSKAVGGWPGPDARRAPAAAARTRWPARIAKQLGQLADEDDERDAVQIAGQDRLGQEGGDEAEPGRAGDQVEHAGHQREDRQQGQIPFRVARCERRQAGRDQQAGGGVRTDDQLPRRAEQGIGQQRKDRRVDADDRGHARELGVGEADRQGDRRDRDPGHDVFGQPAAVVPHQRGEPGREPRQPARTLHVAGVAHGPAGTLLWRMEHLLENLATPELAKQYLSVQPALDSVPAAAIRRAIAPTVGRGACRANCHPLGGQGAGLQFRRTNVAPPGSLGRRRALPDQVVVGPGR